jgi:nucleoside-diphosphate-sugar epimerase/pimeloyl-ACP methyl ester carboxylesterase
MKTCIFLTGASGFLGSHFLLNFIGTKFEHAVVLLRDKDEDQRLEKLVLALKAANTSYRSRRSIDDIMSRITIMQGDIEEKNLGLNHHDQVLLARNTISSFWHFAASLNFEASQKDDIGAKNIIGTLNSVHFAKKIDAAHFFYISTAYTCGDDHGPVKEQLHSMERNFSNYYEESKCRAEHEVSRISTQLELPFTILRPSVVIGNSATKKMAGSRTGLYGFVKVMMRLAKALKSTKEVVRIFCSLTEGVNYIPVDNVMQDIATILEQPDPEGIYHLVSTHYPSNQTAFDYICQQLKINNLEAAEQKSDDLSALEKLLEKSTRFYFPYVNANRSFMRTGLTTRHSVSRQDMLAYIIEAIKELEGESASNVFEHSEIQASDGVPLNVYCNPNFQANPPHANRNRLPVLICNAVGMPVEFLAPLTQSLPYHSVITWESRTLPSPETDENTNISLNRQIEDAVDLINTFNLQKCLVIGWCSGARIALHLAESYTDLVGGLVLLNGSYNLAECDKTNYETNINYVMPKIASNKALATFYHRSIFSRQNQKIPGEEAKAQQMSNEVLSSTDPELLHLTSLPFRCPASLFSYARLINAFLETPYEDRSYEFPFPVLIVTGTDDQIIPPESSEKLSKNIKNAHCVNLKNANHFALYNNEQYPTYIKAYCEKLEKPDKGFDTET